MKRTLIFTAIMGISSLLFAQRPKTLIDSDFGNTSGFGGFMISIQPIDGTFTSLTGGGGAVIIGNRFYLGGYGMGLADDLNVNYEGTDYNVDYGHGGFMLGYVIRPEDVIHFGVGSKIGWGEVSFREKGLVQNPIRVYDNVFIVHPTIEAEANFTNWFKFNVGVGYHLVTGVDNVFYDETDMNGVAFNISFLFGWFD